MTIVLLIEGKTEKAFLPALRRFLQHRLPGRMPRLDPDPYNGRIQKEAWLRRDVERHLRSSADAVVALSDVYTGSGDFADAADVKRKMRAWVGPNERFFPHAAQYEFEAWLLPYWDEIQRLAKHTRTAPSAKPELVNHINPPSARISEIYRVGKSGRSYVKVREAVRILRDKDLSVAAEACPELKEFLNTILLLCGGELM